MLSFFPSALNPAGFLGAAAFSVASCILIARFSRMNPALPVRRRLLGSLGLGLTFWLTHLLITMSVPFRFSFYDYGLHFVFSLVTSTAGSYLAVGYAARQWVSTRRFLMGGVILAAIILLFDILHAVQLFGTFLEWKPELLLLTFGLTLGVSFSVLRMLTIASQDKPDQSFRLLVILGVGTAGVALSGIPVLSMMAVLRLDAFYPAAASPYSFLGLYAVELVLLLALFLIPDRYGESRRLEQTERLLETEQQYASLYEANPDGVFAADIHGCFTRINKQAEALTGYTSEELKGIPFTCLFPERVQTAEGIFSQVIQGRPITKESRICRKDGTYAAVLITALPIIVRDKQLGVYGIIKDITEKVKTQELIQHLAYHDELTGLPNRRAFHLLVEERLAQVGPASAFALFFLDLDRFKKVNDLFGHGFGDLVIREAAAKLRACVPAACSISRMGGDEFTVFVPLDGGVSWQDIAAGIASEFSRPFTVRRQEVKLTTSIGISFWPKDGETAETLIRHADMAMYEAKADGANGFRTYERKMEKTDLEQILLENDLQQAIEDGELTVYYQPKMDTSQGIRIGWEALVRWNHPKRGLIPPGKFIPLAEETGLIVALEREVLRQVCRQLSLWSEGGKPVLPVSINFSQLHLIQSDLYESVMSVVKEHGVDPRLLEIEITESAAMHKEEEVIRVLLRFKEEGIAVSLDDFGTGYSSLSYLKRLPVDCLKIDCSFIRDIATNADSRAIVRMMVTLAAQLGFQVVAEGVETEEQVKLLAELDCVRVQGYLYGKPAPPESWQPGHDAERRQAG